MKDKLTVKTLIPFAEVFSMAISFVNILLMMRVLNMTDYADYSYMVAIVLWASIFMDGGISNLLFNKGLQNDLQDINKLFTTRLFFSGIVFLTVSLFFILRKPELAISGIIYTVVIYFNSTSSVFKWLARGKEYHKIDFGIILTEPLMRLAIFGMVFFVFNQLEWKLWIIMLIYLTAGIIAYSINFYSLSKKIKINIHLENWNNIFSIVYSTFKISKFFILYYLFLIALSRIDVVFMEKYASKTDLALFSSARSLLDAVQLFFFSIISSHFLKIYRAPRKSFFQMILASIFVIIATLLLSSLVFRILFPKEYLDGYHVLNTLVFSLIPFIFINFFIAKLNYEKLTKLNFLLLILPLVLKIGYYQLIKSPDLHFYYASYTLFEYFTLMIFIIYLFFLYRNKSSKFRKIVKNDS